MDRKTNYWGAATRHTEFLIGGFIGAFIGAALYAWLVFGGNKSNFQTSKNSLQ